jgi:mRNA interferase MazF
MKPGDIVLARMPQAGAGLPKIRPVLFLATLPGPYQTILVCGISTKMHSVLLNWDELLDPGEVDFRNSGLNQASVIRSSYLQSLKPAEIIGWIGHIDPARLARLRQRLSDHLRP